MAVGILLQRRHVIRFLPLHSRPWGSIIKYVVARFISIVDYFTAFLFESKWASAIQRHLFESDRDDESAAAVSALQSSAIAVHSSSSGLHG